MKTRTQKSLATILPVLGILLVGTRGAESAETWRPPPYTPMEHVQLTGPWGAWLARAVARLHEAPLDDPGYVLADLALDRKRIFTEYSGDISGRTIGVEAFLARSSEAEAARLRSLIAKTPALQKPDGHFGAAQTLPAIHRATDMPILWGNGRLLIGLVEAYDETANATALSVARKLGEYFVRTDPIYCRPENLTSVGGDYADAFSTCYFASIEGLVGLARVTGERNYRVEAERIADLALSVTNFDHLHSHGRLTALRGILDLYEMTGDEKWRHGVEQDWHTIFTNYRLPTGGITERFSRSDLRDEGCAEADWLRLNLALWRLTGKSAYLDEAERCLNNHFLYNQFASGGSGHRLLQMVGAEPAGFREGGTEAYWCCCEHWPRAMIDAARLAITSAAEGLRVNLFLDATASIEAGGTTWRVRTQEAPDGLLVELTPEKPTEATLCLRKPSWAKGASVEAGGAFTVASGSGDWTVHGRWAGTQTVRVHWPRRIRTEPAPGGGSVLLLGDDVLVAHAVPANAWFFEGDLNRRPTLDWRDSDSHLALRWPLNLPARKPNQESASTPAWHRLELAPMRARNGQFPHRCWFTFDIERSSPAAAPTTVRQGEALPYITAASSGACQVWLNGRELGRSLGWADPVSGFASGATDSRNTLLVLCSPGPSGERPPGIIAAVCTKHGVIEMTSDRRWRVAALTLEESKAGSGAILAESHWQAPRRFPKDQVPSRENRSSVLEDLPGRWLTGNATAEKPILAFRLDWAN